MVLQKICARVTARAQAEMAPGDLRGERNISASILTPEREMRLQRPPMRSMPFLQTPVWERSKPSG